MLFETKYLMSYILNITLIINILTKIHLLAYRETNCEKFSTFFKILYVYRVIKPINKW